MELKSLYHQYESYRQENPFFGKPPGLYEPMQYIMELGGKRARPLLALAAGVSVGAAPEEILPVAHAMEVFHNSSLVHDDIMDNARLRRGKPTVHEKWDITTAILAGDNLLVKSFDYLIQSGVRNEKEVLRMFSRTTREVCEGQQMDMEFSRMNDVSESAYLEMIRLKSAVLLGCCAYCGATAGGASHEKAKRYFDFAEALGMAFQLDDDWLDTFGDESKTGKKSGGDIAEGKKTWLYIKAKNLGLHVSALYENHNGDERIHKATSLFKNNGLDLELKKLSAFYADKASDALQHLAAMGDKTHVLTQLAEMLGKREN